MKGELDKITKAQKATSHKKASKQTEPIKKNLQKKFNPRKNPIIVSYEFSPLSHITEITQFPDGTVTRKEYPFHVADKKEIQKIRFHLLPAVILKDEGVFYVANLPKDAEIVASQFLYKYDHSCNFCNRCSAASDKKGGCAKVRDFHWKVNAKNSGLFNLVLSQKDFPTPQQYEDYKDSRKKDFIKSILESRRIEKYPFLDSAIEGINLKRDFFFIMRCNNLIFLPKSDEIRSAQIQNFSQFAKIDY